MLAKYLEQYVVVKEKDEEKKLSIYYSKFIIFSVEKT